MFPTLAVLQACPLLAEGGYSKDIQVHKCSVLFCRDPLWDHSWKKEEEDDVPDSQECRSEDFTCCGLLKIILSDIFSISFLRWLITARV